LIPTAVNADPGNTGIDLPGRWHLIFHDATVLFWVGLTFLPVTGSYSMLQL
jgi:hypothetical protein